jgi:hypothetical protein
MAAGQRRHRRRAAHHTRRLTPAGPGHLAGPGAARRLDAPFTLQINSHPALWPRYAADHAVVDVGAVTVTITKNQPSPADDTPNATRQPRLQFIPTTNEDQICNRNDG